MVVRAGEVNQLDLDTVTSMLGLVPVINFPTRGDSVLDNFLISEPGLFNIPFPYKALMKSDHVATVLPPGVKLKPVCKKYRLRDFIAHHKLEFTLLLKNANWSDLLNARDNSATNSFNDPIGALMDKCFTVKTAAMSYRPSVDHTSC